MLWLYALGQLRLTFQTPEASQSKEIGHLLTLRQRELLALMALHHRGVSRDELTTTIWPDASPRRPHNAFHAVLSQLRRRLLAATDESVTDLTRRTGAQYRIDSELVRVDLWEFQAAVEAARRQPTGKANRSAALERVVALYTGDFAEDVDAAWAVAPREALRREYLDALSTLVHMSSGADPRHTLDLLERARELDRYNEAIYRDIACIQAKLGQHDAVARTFQLLERALAELGAKPHRETVALFTALRSPSAGDHAPERPR
ncbi:hypothetical protein ACFQVC_00860 [Streptomyces monticola]|uniref:AfsR/SARP family transcriptional regulator n=1 Tax=Streptomyces monticola TaxID=2666263 RepID=A0ABW2J9U0_9ACTN